VTGEWIRLIALNRATGYLGSQRIQLKDASQSPGGMLSFPVEDLVMRPPNLRIWAERRYEVEQGLTQGEDRHYLVGSEGASLASDTLVTVYSEWLDADGRPLPEGLGAADGRQYGLTGRLAKVVAPNLLQAAGQGDGASRSDLASFPIGPGLQKQVLQFRDEQARPEHYYVHVTATQANESPSFEAVGDVQDSPMNTRPGTLTPFLTPLYNEEQHWQEYNAYRGLQRDEQNPIEPQKPLPAYAWRYRPEYQFSRLSLEIAEINRLNTDEAGQQSEENILTLDTPVVGSSDEMIEVLYSLIDAEFDRLEPIDGPQELIFAIGEEEVRVILGEDRSIRIDNLEHLAALDPEDFLTMRLYVNQDAGNVLWEYGFSYFDGAPEQAEVSADTAKLDLVVYAPNVDQKLVDVAWVVEGPGGSLESGVTSTQTGIFTNTLYTSHTRDDEYYVTARVLQSQSPHLVAGDEIRLGPYKVIPGQPQNIEVVASTTELKADEQAESSITATIYDVYYNRVADDIPVSWRLDYDGELQQVVSSTAEGIATATRKKGTKKGDGGIKV
jgi:hypothetical protein